MTDSKFSIKTEANTNAANQQLEELNSEPPPLYEGLRIIFLKKLIA